MIGKRQETATPRSNPDGQHIDTLIGVHSILTGELSFEGAVRIDGQFEGNIHSPKDGTLIVSKGAKVTGEVNVPNLILHGLLEGNVHSANSLKIGETGRLNGDVEYNVLSLSEGSALNGRCARISDMKSKAENSKPAAKGNINPQQGMPTPARA